jgi:hypothetical protein
MTDLSTANGHAGTGELAPPVPRPRDPTGASRAKRYRDNRKAAVTAAVTAPAVEPDQRQAEKPNDFNSHVTLDRDAALRAKRYGEKSSVANGVTTFAKPRWQVGRDTAGEPVTVDEHRTTIDLAAYAAALGLATVAAYFSIRGMVVLFPGAPVAIVAMAVATESAKLVTAGWLARCWRSTAWIWRLALAGFVLGLAVINAGGTYSQLVAAHVGDRSERESYITTKDAELAGKIEVASHAVADLDARVGQIDAAIAEATRRGRTAGAMSIMDAQRRSRAGLTSEREQAAGALAALKAERASVAARGRQAETEAAPIRYVAELVGANTDSERAIRWLIALMVLCCDPLAIALTAAASARR